MGLHDIHASPNRPGTAACVRVSVCARIYLPTACQQASALSHRVSSRCLLAACLHSQRCFMQQPMACLVMLCVVLQALVMSAHGRMIKPRSSPEAQSALQGWSASPCLAGVRPCPAME